MTNRRNYIMTIGKSVRKVEVVALKMDPPVVMEETTSVRDGLNKVFGVEGVLSKPISELMTRDPVCLKEKDLIRKAVMHMHKGGFRNVPILDESGQIITCVWHKDIVHYLVKHYEQHVLNLPPDPGKMPETP